MNGKSALFCNRLVYPYKGKWKSPQNDIEENIYYFISQPATFTPTYKNGREQLEIEMEITVFGGKPIAVRDTITLQDGSIHKIVGVTNNYIESSLYVRDMLKQRIGSQVLVLN